MEKTCSAEINGRNFLFYESAYNLLTSFLRQYRSRLSPKDRDDVMTGVEVTVEQLLSAKLGGGSFVDVEMVRETIAKVGLPDGQPYAFLSRENGRYGPRTTGKRLYRCRRGSMIGGVCSGLSIYLNMDVTILRIIVLLAMIFGFSGFWIYLIFWIAMPLPMSFEEVCAQYGIDPTEENKEKLRADGWTF